MFLDISKQISVFILILTLIINAGDVREVGSIPRSGRSPGGGHSNPLQYSCLENLMDRGNWWATVHRVTKSWTRPKQLSMHACMASAMTRRQGTV